MPTADAEEGRGPDWVCIRDTALDLPSLLARVSHGQPNTGAVSSFLGLTRDNFKGKKVVRLEYEAYVPMAEQVMRKICDQIHAKWDVISVAMEHRLGCCPVGEASVAIVVSSAHRRESLEATAWAIDTLKANVPIWKKEVYDDGTVCTEDPSSSSSDWKMNQEWRGGEAGISTRAPS